MVLAYLTSMSFHNENVENVSLNDITTNNNNNSDTENKVNAPKEVHPSLWASVFGTQDDEKVETVCLNDSDDDINNNNGSSKFRAPQDVHPSIWANLFGPQDDGDEVESDDEDEVESDDDDEDQMMPSKPSDIMSDEEEEILRELLGEFRRSLEAGEVSFSEEGLRSSIRNSLGKVAERQNKAKKQKKNQNCKARKSEELDEDSWFQRVVAFFLGWTGLVSSKSKEE